MNEFMCIIQRMIYCTLYNPEDTQRRFDVRTMFFDRYGRWMDVKATSCAHWEPTIYEASKRLNGRVMPMIVEIILMR